MNISSKLRAVSLACAMIAIGTAAASASVGGGNGDAPTIAAKSLGVTVALNPQPLPPAVPPPDDRVFEDFYW